MHQPGSETELTGLVQTVLGTIDPAKLGATITHEHLLIDLLVEDMSWLSHEALKDGADTPRRLFTFGGKVEPV